MERGSFGCDAQTTGWKLTFDANEKINKQKKYLLQETVCN